MSPALLTVSTRSLQYTRQNQALSLSGFDRHQHSVSLLLCSVQFSSVTQSCPTLCDPTDCSTPGLPLHHQLLELTQTHVPWVSDAIQPSHPLSSPSLWCITLWWSTIFLHPLFLALAYIAQNSGHFWATQLHRYSLHWVRLWICLYRTFWKSLVNSRWGNKDCQKS